MEFIFRIEFISYMVDWEVGIKSIGVFLGYVRVDLFFLFLGGLKEV